MTTEERALHLAKEFGATKANKESAIYRACIKMATEQKAIDDELLKRVHKGVLDKAIKEKKELIDKACEYLRKEYQQMNAIINRLCVKDKGDLIKVEASVESFRKAMED